MKERRLLLSVCGVRIRSTNRFIPSSSYSSSPFFVFFIFFFYSTFDMEITIHFLISKTLVASRTYLWSFLFYFVRSCLIRLCQCPVLRPQLLPFQIQVLD